MRTGSYEDAQGRKWATLLPDGVADIDAAMGLPLGPPSLAVLGLPLEVEVRLHNQLFNRKLFKLVDVKKRRADLFSAIQAAYAADGERIIEVFFAAEGGPAVERPKPLVAEHARVEFPRRPNAEPTVTRNSKQPVGATRRK